MEYVTEERSTQDNFSEEVKDQNSHLEMPRETLCLVQTNVQQQEWEEKERVMTSQLTNFEISRSLLEDKLDEQNKEMKTLKDDLKKANQQLERGQNNWQENMFPLFEA